MNTENLILNYFVKRNGALSYYQLDRKLSADNHHSLLARLRKILDDLVIKSYLISEMIDGVNTYSITGRGHQYLSQNDIERIN